MKVVKSAEIWQLVYGATRKAGFAKDVAQTLADATTEAELHGKTSVGIHHVFYYLQAVERRLINPTPTVTQHNTTAVMLQVQADHGPMQYAYRQAEAALVNAVRSNGIGMLLISGAFAGGELGYYARRLARHGIFTIATANSPAVMSVGSSFDRLLGTNPLCYGMPLDDARALVIDQASSSTALVNIQQYAAQSLPLPEGWALDRHGQPTTKATAALGGTLLPFGGYKGGNIALLVELLAMMGGGDSSIESAPYYEGERTPGIGANIVAIDTNQLGDYQQRIDSLLERFTRDHGAKIRITDLDVADRGVEVRASLWHQLERYIENGTVEELH